MDDTTNPLHANQTVDETAKAEKAWNPYRVFFWGGLIMTVMCVFLATYRLGIKRPARADAYFITGIFGVLSAAMAYSHGKAWARSQRSQEKLKDSLDRLQDRMHDMPRSLMEESVKVAAREAEGRRADQERQARELRGALEDGIRSGFAPLAPALSERIEASLSGLSASMREDREERATSLRAAADTAASLRTAQEDWARASAGLLEKLRAQSETLHNDISGRDTSGRAAWEQLAASSRENWEQLATSSRTTWEKLAASSQTMLEQQAATSAQNAQAALDIQLDKVRTLTESLAGRWEEALRTQRESFAGEWREVLTKSQTQLEQGSLALREAIAGATASVQSVGADAGTRLQANSVQAEEWLRSLAAAAGSIGEALEGMRRGGEESAAAQAANQAEWRATVEMFHQGMGGLLDRLHALGSYTQGQEALLGRMEETIRAFEERSADLIEETAMKAQESLLDALDQAGARDTAIVEDKG